MAEKIVYLFDVDNTLLDNDRIAEDLRGFLEREVGHEQHARYWMIFEQLRAELGYADYLGALQRYRMECPRDLRILAASEFLIGYPFPDRLFPKALDVIAAANRLGQAVILSDGDVVFQPHKIRRSGIYDAVNANVLIYVHKEHELEDVKLRYPADHYVLIDDKLRILTAVKKILGDAVTTVFPQQGHYADDPEITAKYPAADHTVQAIGEFLQELAAVEAA
jgi:FMN phosphatase YigB (HAD superfamily)